MLQPGQLAPPPAAAASHAAAAAHGAHGPQAVLSASAFPGLPPPLPDRKNLQNIRVVQRNLIYVIGISPALASEEVYLLNDSFF